MQSASESLSTDRLDEEDIRLTTGFADVFTAILLVVGFAALNALVPVFMGVVTIILCFVLGRPIVTKRQFAASAIILALSVAVGSGLLFGGVVGTGGLLVAAGASWIYWQMFKVPLSLALAWVALVAFLFSLVGLEAAFRRADASALVAGLMLFALAIRYDASDRLRATRRSDVAFWLHFCAAPVLVHGLFSLVGANPWLGQSADPWLILAIFFVLMLVSLIIDRRPILVSSFSYVLAATARLLSQYMATENPNGGGFNPDAFMNAALAPGIIGLFMLVLAGAWSPVRALILRLLPATVTQLVPGPGTYRLPPDERRDVPTAEKEPLRLVLGFNDIFVAMGAATLFVGSMFLGVWLFAGSTDWTATSGYLPPQIWLPIALPAAAIWLVAEYFVRLRRMAWPAITCAFSFAVTAMLAGWLAAYQFGFAAIGGLRSFDQIPPFAIHQSVVMACAIAALANLLFGWRHRIPLSFALALAALLPLLFLDQWSAIAAVDDRDMDWSSWNQRFAIGGVIVFVVAMIWDRSDIGRQTRRADTAFWLHLLASVLAIPALSSLAMAMGDNGAVVVLAGFAALIVLALVIDRRAPLAIALPFVIAAMGHMFGATGYSLAGLLLAGGLLALALRWDDVRGKLLRLPAPPALSAPHD